MDSPRTRFESRSILKRIIVLLVGQKLSKLTLSAARRSPVSLGTRSPIDSRTIVRIETRQRNADTCPQTDTETYSIVIHNIYIYLCLCPVSCRQSSCSTSTASRGLGLKLKWKLKLRLRLRLELELRLKTKSEILRKDSHRHLGRKCSARISHKASTEGIPK